RSLEGLTATQGQQFAALSLLQGTDAPRLVAEAIVARMSAEEDVGSTELDRLIAYSLVEGYAVAEEGRPYRQRIRLHPLVQELAQQRWDQVEPSSQLTGVQGLLTGVETLVSAAWNQVPVLRPEEPMILEALEEGKRHPETAERVVDLTESLHTYFIVAGRWR